MSDFRIKGYPLGQLGTNCYVLFLESKKEAVIIDPGAEGNRLVKICNELGVTPKAILLTHGHFDHILGIDEVRSYYPDIKIYASEKEAITLKDPSVNLSQAYAGIGYTLIPDVLLKDRESIIVSGITFQVIHTPGHTPGSVCFLIPEEEVLVSGDTLFQESLGRTDLPMGDQSQIIQSIREKLFVLPGTTLVYPGHGDVTTIEHESVYNPVALYRG